ncbi:SiaB family protein kinase [Bacteroidota bacterium]
MSSINTVHELSYVYEIFNYLQDDELCYFYRGEFTQAITESILSLTQSKLIEQKETTKMKKKVYFIMVESLQNIIKHQDDAEELSVEESGVFFIQKRGLKYFITSGNIIEVNNIPTLKGKMEKINSLDETELKEYYLTMLKEGEISEKGGAGLGLIEIAKKSGNKLAFDFKKLNEERSYFYFQTSINSANDEIDTTEPPSDYTVNNVVSLHNKLNDHTIQLIFKGVFNQDTLVYLLEVLKGQLGNSSIKKRTITLIIEMLQNIFIHGYNKEERPEKNIGIFMIGSNEAGYFITAGNFIKNSNIEKLKSRIDQINNVPADQLKATYQKGLMDSEDKFESNAGLGLIKLRLKGKEDLKYYFHPINNHISFYTIQVEII